MFFPELTLSKNVHGSLGVLKAGGFSCPSLVCWHLWGPHRICPERPLSGKWPGERQDTDPKVLCLVEPQAGRWGGAGAGASWPCRAATPQGGQLEGASQLREAQLLGGDHIWRWVCGLEPSRGSWLDKSAERAEVSMP